MATWSIAALRTILATETDADSPGSEELLGQMRENWEALTMLAFDTGITTTSTTIAETVWTDSGSPFANVEVGMTLLITSGVAIGNTYTIDATNSTTTVTCTGDTLVSDGVVITDTAKVMYDLKVNADGHDHDGVNSKGVVLANDTVTEAKLGAIYRTLISTDYGEVYTGQPSVAAGGPTTVVTYPVYVPEGVTTVDVRIKGYATVHNDEVTSTATLGGQASGTATHNDDFIYDTATAITVSGSGWQTLTVAMTQGSSSTAYFLGIILVGY